MLAPIHNLGSVGSTYVTHVPFAEEISDVLSITAALKKIVSCKRTAGNKKNNSS